MAAKAKTSKSKSGSPRTMEELLQKTGYELRGLSLGEKVEGTVIQVTPKSLILDIGAKSEGVVVDREFVNSREFIKTLQAGDAVVATVVVPETESGQSLLSVLNAAEEAAWKELEKVEKEDKEVEVVVEGVTKGGLNVNFMGLQGFVPSSHLGSELAANPQRAFGRAVKTKVIEFDKEGGRLVFSEKAVSEKELLRAQEKALKKIKEGEKYQGKVAGLTSFGAFVQIEIDGTPLDGLVHLSELSWTKIDNPESVVSEGQEVEVVVIGKGKDRLALSMKQAEKDPWKDVSKKYKSDARVSGKVTKLGDFGALIELEPGVEGILHLSKIPAGMSVREGDKVECFIEQAQEKARRISLGLVLKEKPIGYK